VEKEDPRETAGCKLTCQKLPLEKVAVVVELAKKNAELA